MESKSDSLTQKLKSFISIATFIVLVVGVGFLAINFVVALVEKLS